MDGYRTIINYAEAKIEIEKSVFIGVAYPITDEVEVEDCLHQVKVKHPNANHYVYAYTIGRNHLTQKFSDDGEPSGTGGMPILELFKYKELEDILIVVVRYFGGTKLGTGGLKRAYSRAAQDAILLAGTQALTLCRLVKVLCPYTYWGKVQYELESKQIRIENIDYQEEVLITVAIALEKMDFFVEWINGMTASQALIEEMNTSYRDVNID